MIGPVSGTGRAMMASLQQQMAKGMPPDQAIAYVKSMAQDGVAPLVDLYAMMKQFQRLKEQQVKPPQNPPTVRDQIMAMSQQGVPQQGQGMQPPPMEQGLGGMNAGSMENPKFAGGGVVALAEGGGLDVESIYGQGSLGQRDPAMLQKFGEAGSAEDLARMYAMALSRKDFDTASRLEQYMTRMGISSADINEIRRKTAEGLGAVGEAQETEAKEAARRQRKLTGFGVTEPPPEAAPTQSAVPTAPPPQEKPAPARVIKKPPVAAAAPKEMTLEDRIAEQQAPLIKRGLLTKEGKSAATQAYRDILKGEDERMNKYFGKQKSYALAEAGFKMAQAASRPGATFLGALSEGGMSHAQAMQAMNKEIELNRRQMQQQNYLLDKADEADARGDVDKALTLRAKHEDQMIDLQKHRERLLVDLKQIEVAGENAAATRELRTTLMGQSERDKLIDRLDRMREKNPQYLTLQAKLAKEKDPEKVAQIEADLADLDKKLLRQATGADLPGMTAGDVTRTSDAIANLSGEDLAQRLRKLGYNVTSPTR